MVSVIYLFIISIVLGILSLSFSISSKKSSIEVNKTFLKFRNTGIIILVLGFIVHTLGDFLGFYYREMTEHSVESLAHVIIFISFIFFINASKDILKNAKEYWLN